MVYRKRTMLKKKYAPKKRATFRKSIGLPKIMTGLQPFPPSMFVKLNYSDNLTSLTSGLGNGLLFGTEQVYRLGGVYDPDFSGTGHQPYGYDVYTQIYHKCKVYGVTIDARWSDAGLDGTVCGILINASTDSTTLNGMNVSETERTNLFTVMVNNTGSQFKRFKRYFSIAKIDGLTKQQFDGDFTQYASSVTTNPTLTPYVRFAVANMASTPGVKCNLNLKLTYHVKFFDRKSLPQS